MASIQITSVFSEGLVYFCKTMPNHILRVQQQRDFSRQTDPPAAPTSYPLTKIR